MNATVTRQESPIGYPGRLRAARACDCRGTSQRRAQRARALAVSAPCIARAPALVSHVCHAMGAVIDPALLLAVLASGSATGSPKRRPAEKAAADPPEPDEAASHEITAAATRAKPE